MAEWVDNNNTENFDYLQYNEEGERKAIVQGRLIIVPRTKPHIHAGGGKRSKQCGHGQRAANRLHNYLLTCKPCKQVIWLTFEPIIGPSDIHKYFRRFATLLEKELEINCPALGKMEVQQRLSPELAILFWPQKRTQITENMVGAVWKKVSPHGGRVKVEVVRNWSRLASYISKAVEVTPAGIFIGGKHRPFLIPDSNASVIATYGNEAYSNESIHNDTGFDEVIKQWCSYHGRYHWRYRKNEIPQFIKDTIMIPNEHADHWRNQVNSKRRRHFLGKDTSITLRGQEAIKAYPALGYNPLCE